MRSSFQALIWFFHLIPHQICVNTSQNVKKFQQNVLRSTKSGRSVLCTGEVAEGSMSDGYLRQESFSSFVYRYWYKISVVK